MAEPRCQRLRWMLAIGFAVGFLLSGVGCALGPRTIEHSRLRYNEAIKTTTEQQLLLNIVRLRYIDTPSSLSISSIADQQELMAGLQAMPFFTSAAAGNLGTYQGMILPQAQLSRTSRPTLSFTPLDDQEFTRRLFTPISLEGVAYISRSTWPISTVFRLYLENMNWVPNGEIASGPTPKVPPEFKGFLEGVRALQRLEEARLVEFFTEEREEKLSDPFTQTDQTPLAAVEAAKAGLELRKDRKGGWTVQRKKQQIVLRVREDAGHEPDYLKFCQVFKLNPAKRSFDITTDKLDPFLKNAPREGLETIDLETRSLLQVLFFVSHGVQVPPAQVEAGVVPQAINPVTGEVFQWDELLGDLFVVKSSCGKCPPEHAYVAVCYRDTWFYIDDRDRDTKATFALLIELSRLELGSKTGTAPILTLPLGG
ncbi:MAG: hypothetical protein U0840_21525 [Gemmataceae bacterium]